LNRRQFFSATLASGVAGRLAAQPGKDRPETITVPARAVTKGPNHHWFGYYDKTPWDSTGRYLLAMEADFCDRQPRPEDIIRLGMVDLKSGYEWRGFSVRNPDNEWRGFDTTRTWCWQQGCMLQWLGSAPDREVVYNVHDNGEAVAVVRDVHTSKFRLLPRPIYAISADGKQAVTLDFARLHRLRPGYGYAFCKEQFADNPAPEKLGVWWMDMASGKNELVVTLKQLAANKPDGRFRGAHHWVNHLLFNPGGTRFVFLHRWRVGVKPWFTRVYTAKPDGTDLRLHLDTGMASHFDWRDDHTLLFWARTPTAGNKFCLIDTRTDEVTVVGDGVLTQDGHCSYSPDRKWVLNDTYPDRDRMQWLMLYNPRTGRRYDLNKFHSPKQFTGPWRCDLHPRWNRDGTQVCIDGCHGPQRQVYVLDVSEVVRS
jgi:hypothetical protein